MLVLARKVKQSCFVGPNRELEIRILSVKGNTVRLGFIGPRHIQVTRDDIQPAKTDFDAVIKMAGIVAHFGENMRATKAEDSQ